MKSIKRMISLSLCVMLLAGLAVAPAASAGDTLASGLVAYFSMEDAVTEQIQKTEPVLKDGNGLTYEEGIQGKAMRFSMGTGASARLELENREDLKFGDQAFSAAFWVKSGTPSGDTFLIGDKDWEWGTNKGWCVTMDSSDGGRFRLNTRHGGLRRDDYVAHTFDPSKWIFVAVGQSEAGETFLYVDGEKSVETNAYGADSQTPAGNLSIGSDIKGQYGIRDKAALDEIRIWNRVLSQEEIEYLYHSAADDLAVSGPEVLDLTGAVEEKTMTLTLSGKGGVDNSAQWRVSPSDGVRITETGKTAVLSADPAAVEGAYQVTAEYYGKEYTYVVQLVRDPAVSRIEVQSPGLIVLTGLTERIDCEAVCYNQYGTQITPENPAGIRWSLENAPEGVSYSGSGTRITLAALADTADDSTVAVKAACGAVEGSQLISVVHNGTMPKILRDQAELYLKMDGTLEDEKGNELTTGGVAPITFQEGRSGQGAVFTQGNYIDFGNYPLANKTIAFSFKSNRFTGVCDPAIMGNKDWDDSAQNGFIFAYSFNTTNQIKNRLGGTGVTNTTLLDYSMGKWKNFSLVFDETGKKYTVYADGAPAGTVDTEGYASNWMNGGDGCTLRLGNDGTPNGYEYNTDPNSEYEFVIDNFMILDHAVTAQEAKMLDSVYQADKSLRVDIIGAPTAAEGATYNLNVHVGGNLKDATKVTFDVYYNKELMKFPEGGYQVPKRQTNLDTSPADHFHIEYIPAFPIQDGEAKEYSQSRIIKLNFDIMPLTADTLVPIRVENIHAYKNGVEMPNVSISKKGYDLTLCKQNVLDYNGDGVIGAGDVALAPPERKQAAAEQAGIFPYKRAIAVTMDGAGNVWDPENAHYVGDKTLEEVRTNDYAMRLHNEEFAISYSARSMDPPISAQNYTAITHGVTWKDLPRAYQVTNESAAAEYFPDLGKEEALYPSIFEVIRRQAPTRPTASFTEWAPITDGIVEPDCGAYGQNNGGSRLCFDMAVDYMKTPAFKKTAFLYMQSNDMDNQGHGHGYFNDAYYARLKEFDDHWKRFIDGLKATGMYDDTLIISNADHGGSDHGHGDPSLDTHMDIYIGVGGQTVEKGKRLEGGSNDDICGIALAALRLDKPQSMGASEVFDSGMFLKQEEMGRKNRDIETVSFFQGSNTGRIVLSNPKKEIRVIDAVIALNGRTVREISTQGQILRQTADGETLKLTIAFDQTPEEAALLTFDGGAGGVKIHEVMLGAADGSEIYCDLKNLQENISLLDPDTQLFIAPPVFTQEGSRYAISAEVKKQDGFTETPVMIVRTAEGAVYLNDTDYCIAVPESAAYEIFFWNGFEKLTPLAFKTVLQKE